MSGGETDRLAWLSVPEQETLAAAVARIIPRDADPGAVEAGVLSYLAGFLGGVDRIHATPDGDGFVTLDERTRAAWADRISLLRDKYRAGLQDLERRALDRFGGPFAALSEDEQDSVLARLEEDSGVRGGRPPANQPVSSDDEPFLVALAMHVRQGFYGDPVYGGNRDGAGWNAIGFDGPGSMRDVRLGRYTTRAYLGEARDQTASPPDDDPNSLGVAVPTGWGTGGRGEPADVCIVGTGAGGGMAAYLLARAGLRVVVLERGPWMKAEDFAPDELAAFNRYQIWPDPSLHPRTYRSHHEDPAQIQEFSPMPALVGGGTIHWSAWTPRPLAADFSPRSEVGAVAGASLVDWPIGYAELEPYMDKVERLLGVGGIAGANPHEEPRGSAFPLPPLPQSRYGERFERGCRELGLRSFPMPQAIPARPYGGRPASRDNGFVQQYGDSTDAKASSLNACLGPALATGRARPPAWFIRTSRGDRRRRPRYWRRVPGRGRSRAGRSRARRGGRLRSHRVRSALADVGHARISRWARRRVRTARREPDVARVHVRDRAFRRSGARLRMGGVLRGRLQLRLLQARRGPRPRPRVHGVVLGPGPPDQLHVSRPAALGPRRQGSRSLVLQPQPEGRRSCPGPPSGVQPRRPRSHRARRLGPPGRARHTCRAPQ